MKNKILFLYVILAMLMATSSLEAQQKSNIEENKSNKSALLEKKIHQGIVTDTMSSGGYTYIQFKEDGKEIWSAAPQFLVKAGDLIQFANPAPMKDFYSKTLKRSFNMILFVSKVKILNSENGKLEGKTPQYTHPKVKQKLPKKYKLIPGSIPKAKNGYTVSECFLQKDKLQGKIINIRAIVVKFSAKIMGKNWLHLRDGTGEQGSNDITVTSKQMATIGDTVLIKGKLYLDKDFGSGYFYPLIIEEAEIKIEKTIQGDSKNE